jgi:[ribosomal protein S18]-alanine N-acetyltransferase
VANRAASHFEVAAGLHNFSWPAHGFVLPLPALLGSSGFSHPVDVADMEGGRMSRDQVQAPVVHIRWMIRRDMAEVLQIEHEGFEFPWSEDDFIRCLRQRNCIGMVAEQSDLVTGFMIYELHRTRLHLLNFAVGEAYRRRGIGTHMIAKLVAKLSPQRRSRVVLEVRETNLAAQLFFRSQGFRAVSVLRNFYEDSPEDAYVMQFRYRSPEATPAPISRITRIAG